ncbi:MAG: CbiX/SirB N-terminal domain-containing protein, partial [SAR324 cluster bacterium]|nr:CbiX/SirB N-terminal domain-containing protein [SAR324 cluster bacterium]
SRSVTADILLAHGSRDAMWRKSFENLLEKSRIKSPNKKFRLCYLELCKPNLNEVIEELTENNSKITTIIIHPIFLSAGVHFNKDIRTMVIDLQSIYPYLKFKINDVVGNNTIVSDAIIKVVSS